MSAPRNKVEVIDRNRFGILAYDPNRDRYLIFQQIYDVECIDYEDLRRIEEDKDFERGVGLKLLEIFGIDPDKVARVEVVLSGDYKYAILNAEVERYMPSWEMAKIFDELNLILSDRETSCVIFGDVIDFVKGEISEDELLRDLSVSRDIVSAPSRLLIDMLRRRFWIPRG